MKELIKRLTEEFGPAGFERPVRELIAAEIKGMADEIRTDIMGNLVALKKGKDSHRRVMLAGHMDEIGLMAAWIDPMGLVRFSPIGGLRPLCLVGSRVQFANGTIGVINADKQDDATRVPNMDQMFVDVGGRDEASCPVRIGDPAVFCRPCVEQGSRMIAKALDDRIGCLVLIETLRNLGTPAHDTYFVFSVQEEVGIRGAVIAAYGAAPDIGIAVDVCVAGDTPQTGPRAVRMEGGAAINVKDMGSISHTGLREWVVRVADENGIRHQPEIGIGGTDARAIQTTREGAAVTAISIPSRHVHTPSEIVDLGDVQSCIDLCRAVLLQPIRLE